MNKYSFAIVVCAENEEQAEQVVAERIDHDEEIGFDYTVEWFRTKRSNLDEIQPGLIIVD